MARDLTGGKIKEHDCLTLCVDGGCEPMNPGGVATSGWVIYGELNQTLVEECRVVQDGGPLATNNYAEYCSLGFALRWLKDQNWRGQLTIQADSQLLINQVLGKWKCKAEHLRPLRQRIWDYMDDLCLTKIDEENSGMLFGPDGEINPANRPCIMVWVPREQNERANELCRIAYQEHIKSKRNNA
jgi:ribonuclease HI